MKNILLAIFIGFFSFTHAQIDTAKTALLIIDIQDFYFPGGDSELIKPEEASLNAKILIDHFRKNKLPVVHVRHNYEPGGSIHLNVKPIDGEKIVSKNAVNCFKDTDLLSYLKQNNIDTLVICGMQTHMCVEAATRASNDYNFKTILIHDACATKDLKFQDKIIKAEDVHFSTLSTLKSYAKITDTKTYIEVKE